MGTFIIYIGIIRPLFCFDYTNFKVSLIIRIINFNGIKKMAHLIMLIIFHVNVIICQISISHTCITFLLEKTIFWNENFQINHMVQIMWNGMVQYTFHFHKNKKSFKLFLKYIFVFEYIFTWHLFHKYTSISHVIKWNDFLNINILPRLYSNIICKNVVNFFQNFEVGYIQTCTPLESNTMWRPTRGHYNVLSL
jgi:hypothetical protein